MIVTIDNLKLKLEWRHSNPDFNNSLTSFVGTECILTIMSDNQAEPSIEVTAKTKLHPGDSFCKDKGRRISLQRIIKKIAQNSAMAQTGLEQAVRVSFYSKAFRKQLWNFYLNKTNPKLYKPI